MERRQTSTDSKKLCRTVKLYNSCEYSVEGIINLTGVHKWTITGICENVLTLIKIRFAEILHLSRVNAPTAKEHNEA